MLIYIFLLLMALVIFSLKNTKVYKDIWIRRLVTAIYTIILFCISVFRSIKVGKDYLMYYSIYTSGNSSFLKTHFIESGYVDLNSFAQNLGNFYVISAICFIIYFFGMYYLSKVYNLNTFLFLSLFIISYIYIISFNLMRQSIALGIICFGLYFYKKLDKHKIIRYIVFIIFVLLAQKFHNSAVFCFIFLALNCFNISRKSMFVYYFIAIYSFVTNDVGNLANTLIAHSSYYSMKYLNSSSMFVAQSQRSITQFFLLLVQIVFVHLYINYNKNYKYDSGKKYIVNGYLLYIFLETCSNLIFSRLRVYLSVFFLLFSCLIFTPKKNPLGYGFIEKNWRLIKLIFLIFLILYYLLELLVTNNGNVVPYSLFN